MAVVVDTNVPMVASGRHRGADMACVNSCVQRLAAITREGGLLIDDLGLVLREYTTKLGFAGQPGAGEKFVKWVFSNQENTPFVRKVAITRRASGDPRQFDEFPADPALAGFDPADQKFAAVALASGVNPLVINATDSDWADHHAALVAAGVRVEFLCPQHCTP